MTTYQQALDFIWGLVNFETTPPDSREPYTLERMRALLAALGNPETKVRAIHIAGTKGKGSTSAMIERVLRAAGHRTALFTSPHLHDARERIQLHGEPLPEAEFISLVETVKPHIERLGTVTTFEALTAMAFLRFARPDIDIAVIEVGLGGRLDATNLITPLVSVITPLALEHTVVLGNTIEEIASEKGGIIKEGVPVVTASQLPAALATLRQIAAARHAPILVASEEWTSARRITSLDGQIFDLRRAAGGDEAGYEALHLPLLGAHQIDNATVAVAALHLLQEAGVSWDEAALRDGLARVQWPARVEVLQRSPLVVADGAHTAESAAALVATLRDAMPGGWGRSTLIFGLLGDKDLTALVRALEPLMDRIILVRTHHPRATDPMGLTTHPALASRNVRIVTEVSEALREALEEAGERDIVVATGSLSVAAEAREAFRMLRGTG